MKQITPNERALPLYQAGLSASQDIGLAFALTALTDERVRQGHLLAAHPDLRSPAASHAAYADGCLHEVTKTVSRRFRTPATERTAP